MDKSKLHCVFCEEYSFDKLCQFDAISLEKCEEILQRRILWNLKYADTELPDSPNDTKGYHSVCYKLFITMKKKYFETDPTESVQTENSLGPSTQDDEPDDDIVSNVSFKSEQKEDSEHSSKSDSCHGENVCLFCGKARKTVKRQALKLHISSCDFYPSLKNAAQKLEDSRILNLLENDSANTPYYYHLICYTRYRNNATSASKEITPFQIERLWQGKAFKELELFLEKEIIQEGKTLLFSTVMNTFKDFLQKLAPEGFEKDEITFNERHLQNKITETFNKKLRVTILHRKKMIIPMSGINNDLVTEEVQEVQDDDVLDKAADILRKRILKMTRNKLPKAVKTENVLEEDESSVPPFLLKYYKAIICGRDHHRRKQGPQYSKQVNDHCQDLMYAVSNGKIGTSKQITSE